MIGILMKCHQCNQLLSTSDKTCPKCGEPNPGYILRADQRMVHVEDRATKEWGKDIEYDPPKYFLKGFFQLFKPYITLSGTMGRSQFWSIQLIILLIDLPMMLYVIQEMTGWIDFGLSFSAVRFFLVTNVCWLLPLFGAEIRRLHDANLSGWWLLLKLIPGPGTLILVYLLLKKSDPQTRYS